jgi:hypothetical protein
VLSIDLLDKIIGKFPQDGALPPFQQHVDDLQLTEVERS